MLKRKKYRYTQRKKRERELKDFAPEAGRCEGKRNWGTLVAEMCTGDEFHILHD